MTPVTRLCVIFPEDKAVLFTHSRSTPVCLLVDLISASSTPREQPDVFITGNSEAAPLSEADWLLLELLSCAGDFNWLLQLSVIFYVSP